MRSRTLCRFVLWLAAWGMLAGCASQGETATVGAAAVPAPIRAAQGQVLAYVTSSARLADVPAVDEWLADEDIPPDGSYRFQSGDWRMLVWSAVDRNGHRKVLILDQARGAFWCGYVAPDGSVVDTALLR